MSASWRIVVGMIPKCPTCDAEAESATRYIDGSPTFLSPCGHYVELARMDPVPEFASHRIYGDAIREHEIDPECWDVWRLTTSRGSKRFTIDPPLEWLQGFRRKAS